MHYVLCNYAHTLYDGIHMSYGPMGSGSLIGLGMGWLNRRQH